MHDPNRTYSEKEIQALLERTAQLQVDEAESSKKSSSGLTLSELETIAGDSGLDPALLQRAALEMEIDPRKTGYKSQTNTHIRTQRLVSGELSDDEWEEVVYELKQDFDSSMEMTDMGSYGQGIAEKVGRNYEWRHTSLSGIHTRLSIRPYKGGTKVELTQRVGLASTMVESWFYAAILAFLIAIPFGAATSSLPIAVATTMATLAMAVPLIHTLDKSWRAKKLVKLNELADKIGDIIGHELMDLASTRERLPSASVQPLNEGRIELPEQAEQDQVQKRSGGRERE